MNQRKKIRNYVRKSESSRKKKKKKEKKRLSWKK